MAEGESNFAPEAGKGGSPEVIIGQEPKATDLEIIQKPEGSFGVFKEYPEELINKIADQVASFRQQERDRTYGYRDKFPLNITLEDGREIKLYVKPKFMEARIINYSQTAKDDFESYQEDKQRAAHYEQFVQELGGQEIADLLGVTSESLLADARFTRLTSSALNEIMINRRAAYGYQQKYGEDLPIEKPVGFAAERDGKKWVIFEFIEDIIDPKTLPDDIMVEVEKRADEFAGLVDERLRSIGVIPGDLVNKALENMVITGDSNKPNSLKFTLIDTEEWLPVKKSEI